MNVRICDVGQLSSWIRCMVSVTSYIMLYHSLHVESSSQLNKEDSHVSRVEAKWRCHAHVFCSQIEWKQHPKTQNHMDLPKTLNQTTQNGFLSKPPTPPRWKTTEFSTQEKDYVFQPGPAEAIGMCLTEDGVSPGMFWDGEVYVNISCQSVLVCKKFRCSL